MMSCIVLYLLVLLRTGYCATINSTDYSGRQFVYRQPDIITAAPVPSDNFELVVGTNIGRRRSRPYKTSRMDTELDYFNNGQFGLRLDRKNTRRRRPTLQSGFKPRPLAAILKNREPSIMLPRPLPSSIRIRKRPKPPYLGQQRPDIVLSPASGNTGVFRHPLKNGRPMFTPPPWPHLSIPGRPISPVVLEHLIKNVRGNVDGIETDDTMLIPKIQRTGVTTTVKPPRKPWPTGKVVSVSRPPWLGNLDIATGENNDNQVVDEDILKVDLNADRKSDSDYVNTGSVDIAFGNQSDFLQPTKSPKYPSSTSRMTTENLAYVLIGCCTILSITFLVIVAVSMHCRRIFHRKKVVKEMSRSGYIRPNWYRDRYNGSPDYYLHGVKNIPRHKHKASNLFSLPGRGMMRTRPANTGELRYETVGIGNNKRIKRTTVALPNGVFLTDGRHKMAADIESFTSSPGDTGPCTCSSHLSDNSSEFRGHFSGEQNVCHCRFHEKFSRHCCEKSHASACQATAGPSTSMVDYPGRGRAPCPDHPNRTPPVSGSNYLSNPDGVIFWSGNHDRLI